MNYGDIADEFAVKEGERLAIVLVGGGAKGRWEYGALMALERIGILKLATFMVGTSTGAIQAVLAGMSLYKTGGLAYGAQLWNRVQKNSDVFEPKLPLDGFGLKSIPALFKLVPRLKSKSLVDPKGLRSLLTEACGNLRAEELFDKAKMSVWVTATNRDSRATDLLGGADKMYDMALASSAIPCVFPPHELDGVEYVDGGLLDNHPVDQAVQLGATKIIIIYCDPDPAEDTPPVPRETVPGIALDSLDTLFSGAENQMWKAIDLQEQLNAAIGGPTIEYLHIYPLTNTGNMLDFSKTSLLEQGITETLQQINPGVMAEFLLS